MKRTNKNKTKKKKMYGFLNTLEIQSKSPVKFIMAIVNIVNQKKLDNIFSIRVIEHPIEEQFVVTFINEEIWKGTIAEIKEYQKQGASLLIELFESKVMDILIKRDVTINNLRKN